MTGAPLLSVESLVRDYALPRRNLFGPRPLLRALHGVSLTVPAGRSLGVVGESGCGKSTLARAVMALERPDGGTVRVGGRDLFALSPGELRKARRDFQMVFQDPYGSLDPRHTVARIVAEPLDALAPVPRQERRARIAAALAEVGLSAEAGMRYPHEFSGGQRQRIAIARALITRPKLIVADEPVSALDVSVQAQILNLMLDLQEEHRLSYLFISHDLAIVRHVADEVAVMYQGRIVERGPVGAVFSDPVHPYTRQLLAAVPVPDPARRRRPRAAPAEADVPPASGCPFAPRCPLATPVCRDEEPALETRTGGREAACHHA